MAEKTTWAMLDKSNANFACFAILHQKCVYVHLWLFTFSSMFIYVSLHFPPHSFKPDYMFLHVQLCVFTYSSTFIYVWLHFPSWSFTYNFLHIHLCLITFSFMFIYVYLHFPPCTFIGRGIHVPWTHI